MRYLPVAFVLEGRAQRGLFTRTQACQSQLTEASEELPKLCPDWGYGSHWFANQEYHLIEEFCGARQVIEQPQPEKLQRRFK